MSFLKKYYEWLPIYLDLLEADLKKLKQKKLKKKKNGRTKR